MFVRMWSKGNIPALLVGVKTYIVSMEINMMALQRVGILFNLKPLLGIYPKEAPFYHNNTSSIMFIVIYS